LRRDDGTRRARRELRRWRGLSIRRRRGQNREAGDDGNCAGFHFLPFFSRMSRKGKLPFARYVPRCRSTGAGACSLRGSIVSHAPENKMRGRYQNSKSMLRSCPAPPLWEENAMDPRLFHAVDQIVSTERDADKA
jgi:hypothetical protein